MSSHRYCKYKMLKTVVLFDDRCHRDLRRDPKYKDDLYFLHCPLTGSNIFLPVGLDPDETEQNSCSEEVS